MGSSAERWPQSLWLVRHGESAGNVARYAAEAAGHAVIDVAERDMDVPLSARGKAQARALGDWMAEQPDRPTHTLASPYVRAQQTAQIALEAAGCASVCVDVDERLREREFGILDRLTTEGIRAQHPEQAAARAFLGKFYHRPPGGESWADVALRVRSVIDSIGLHYAGERLLVVSHQVVIMIFRYLLERLSEQDLLAIDKTNKVANCSVTVYEFDPSLSRFGGMTLKVFNDVRALREEGEAVTSEPDAQVAPR